MIADVKPYPQMKDSGVPWLGKVPEHWEVRRLKHAFRKIVGGSTPASSEPTYWDGDVVWVTPADISRTARLATSLRRITREGLRSCSSELVPPGSIVVTSRAPVGNVAIAETELCTNQGCKALVATAAVVNPVFGFHVLTTLKGELQSLATGTTFTEISTSRLCAVAIPLPPLLEQTAIVRFLDHADRRIRRYIRAKQKLIKLLEEQKQAIIHRAVTRGLGPNVRLKPSGVEWLGDVPEHWEVARLGRLIELITGFPFKSDGFTQDAEDIRLLRGVNISPGKIRWTDVVRWPLSERDKYSALELQVGDIVLGMDRPLIQSGTRVAIVTEHDVPALLLQRVARIRPRDELQSEFLALLLAGKSFADYLTPIFTGISVPHLSPEQIRSFCFALPTDNEQREIVRWSAEKTRKTDVTISDADREIQLLREFRTRLIADVVTGKLDVREAAARLPEEGEDHEPLYEAEALGDTSEESAADDFDAEPEEAGA